MISKFKNVLNKLTLCMTVLAMTSLIICIAVNFYEIVNRYFFGKSLYWIQDFTLLMMMWFIFPGITRVSYDAQDILIDIFISRLPAALRRVVSTIVNFAVTLFCFLMSWQSWRMMKLNWNKNMNISGIPTRFFIVIVIFSFIIVGIIYAYNTIVCATGKKGEK